MFPMLSSLMARKKYSPEEVTYGRMRYFFAKSDTEGKKRSNLRTFELY